MSRTPARSAFAVLVAVFVWLVVQPPVSAAAAAGDHRPALEVALYGDDLPGSAYDRSGIAGGLRAVTPDSGSVRGDVGAPGMFVLGMFVLGVLVVGVLLVEGAAAVLRAAPASRR